MITDSSITKGIFKNFLFRRDGKGANNCFIYAFDQMYERKITKSTPCKNDSVVLLVPEYNFAAFHTLNNRKRFYVNAHIANNCSALLESFFNHNSSTY